MFSENFVEKYVFSSFEKLLLLSQHCRKDKHKLLNSNRFQFAFYDCYLFIGFHLLTFGSVVRCVFRRLLFRSKILKKFYGRHHDLVNLYNMSHSLFPDLNLMFCHSQAISRQSNCHSNEFCLCIECQYKEGRLIRMLSHQC